ncbi:MAG: hypothetical protein H6Q90_84 [Deltaproteobacteria bacterium]|nr:hypothetical protein [Deltaproteobacteria bacterium]
MVTIVIDGSSKLFEAWWLEFCELGAPALDVLAAALAKHTTPASAAAAFVQLPRREPAGGRSVALAAAEGLPVGGRVGDSSSYGGEVTVYSSGISETFLAIVDALTTRHWHIRSVDHGNAACAVAAYHAGIELQAQVSGTARRAEVAVTARRSPRTAFLVAAARRHRAALSSALRANPAITPTELLLAGEILARAGMAVAPWFDELAVEVQGEQDNLVVAEYVGALPEARRGRLVSRLFEANPHLQITAAELAPTDEVIEQVVIPRILGMLAKWSSRDYVYNGWWAGRIARLLDGRGIARIATAPVSRAGATVAAAVVRAAGSVAQAAAASPPPVPAKHTVSKPRAKPRARR